MYSSQCHKLHVPTLEEVRNSVQAGLAKNFAQVSVDVVDCPDLTSPPYSLAGKGLSGSARVADVGGVPNLMPLVDRTKIYDMSKLAEVMELPDAFIVGAGAGPFNYVGVNSEMVGNVVTGRQARNESRIIKIENDNYKLQNLPKEENKCGLLFNMFASEGLPGKVLRVRASKRTGEEDFVSAMRKGLNDSFHGNTVALGGVFRLNKGSVKCHVMPDFSKTPLQDDDAVNNWLRFFSMPAPMVFASVFVSQDPGWGLRIEHSHGYGKDYGGHYHYDTTPETVEYEGYYNVAEYLYRIDQPKPQA